MLKLTKIILATALLWLVLPLTSSVLAQSLPDNLKVPDGQMLLLKAMAKGVQIYVCQADAKDATKFAWTFKAPEATLYDANGVKIGMHYAGPTWENLDGSKVAGAAQQSATVDASAIPWLLLKAKSSTGTGLFSNVTYVQRLDTVGGVAPTSGCDKDHAALEQRVDYTANYVFYIAAPSNIQVPSGQSLLLKGVAKGVQIYVCQADAKDATKFAWTFKAPEATLYDANGVKIGMHYAGPTWENLDGSKVAGAAQQSATVDASAIPWLLLKAKTNTGTGLFSNVTYVQRLDTVGGVAPTTGCDKDHAALEQRVDYTANYLFYIAAPSNIQVPSGQSLLLKVAAKGVQIYVCQADAKDATKFAWTFKAPEATLYDANGVKIGMHYAGPTWENLDGSKVVGAAQQSATVDASAIPWLLLKAKSNAGTGLFSNVTYVQRLDTVGGVAPTSGCDKDHAALEQRVNYTANYYFFAATSSVAATDEPTLETPVATMAPTQTAQ